MLLGKKVFVGFASYIIVGSLWGSLYYDRLNAYRPTSPECDYEECTLKATMNGMFWPVGIPIYAFTTAFAESESKEIGYICSAPTPTSNIVTCTAK